MKETISWRELPDLLELDREIRRKAAPLLEQLHAVIEIIEAYSQEAEQLKTALTDIQEQAGVKGLRYGPLCFVSRVVPGRRTLDRNLLIENGVSPKVIEKSMKQGEESKRREFKNLEKGGESGSD